MPTEKSPVNTTGETVSEEIHKALDQAEKIGDAIRSGEKVASRAVAAVAGDSEKALGIFFDLLDGKPETKRAIEEDLSKKLSSR